MMPRDQYIDDLLMDYASGTLDDALCLLMASYLTLSPAARRRAAHLEALGGALLGLCEPVAMCGTSLDAVMARLGPCVSEPASASCPGEDCRSGEKNLPRPLHRRLADPSACEGKWQRLLPGLKVMKIAAPGCAHHLMLARAAPGAKTPAHSHGGTEITLVLQGGFSDEHGAYSCGDIVIYEPGIQHSPRADAVEGCLALVASSGPVRFSGFFLRALTFFRQ